MVNFASVETLDNAASVRAVLLSLLAARDELTHRAMPIPDRPERD